MSSAPKSVAVAMSGGVDSSVSAILLAEEGYSVTGVTMRLIPAWTDIPDTEEAVSRAQHVCEHLGIEHRIVDAESLFSEQVIASYASEYADGRTPNPCVTCNERMKLGFLWDWARENHYDYLATGHYARTDGTHLMRAHDRAKDQSYFLYRVARDRLSRVLFPLSVLDKDTVRRLARDYDLPNAESAESQDVCFIDKENRRKVVTRFRPDAYEPGVVAMADGTVIGQHHGLACYTVGQRHGLGIAGSPDPLYAIALDADNNRVLVGRADEGAVQTLECDDFVLDMNALNPGEGELQVEAMARYNMTPEPARLVVDDTRISVTFQQPLTGISPGQSVVCYRDEVVVAGGFITCVC